MTDEQSAAYIMSQAAVLFATISGMNAENQQRAYQGSPIAYGEKDFENAVSASGVHHNAVMTAFE